MRVMIVGATSTIGQRCAMCYRAKGYDLTLIGRTRSNLLRVKQELQKNKTGKKLLSIVLNSTISMNWSVCVKRI